MMQEPVPAAPAVGGGGGGGGAAGAMDALGAGGIDPQIIMQMIAMINLMPVRLPPPPLLPARALVGLVSVMGFCAGTNPL